MLKKKIILITPGQPALNPRLVKEADALADNGYDVLVLYSYWNGWGTKYDNELIPAKKWQALLVGGSPQKKPLVYFLSRLIHKISKAIINKVGPINCLTELAVARNSYFLIKEAKKHKADAYIGHNLGALAATVKAAKKNKAKCGFDAEDFHRYEVNDDQNSLSFRVAKFIEDKYLNQVDYLTASSQQISDAYGQLYPDKYPITILNVFNINDSPIERKINADKPLRLFWFSQTIGYNRGLDALAEALHTLKNIPFELHLLGYIPPENKSTFLHDVLKNYSSVYFYDPIPPDQLISFASQFDIGLALEPGFSINNNLALSNKIFTYIQAGLAVIASDTPAQKYFLAENKDIGRVYNRVDIKSLIHILSHYNSNRNNLFKTCSSSAKLGLEKLNWENESTKFLSLVQNIISQN